MSTNGNQWKPSLTHEVTCPSGQKVLVKRPGPEFAIRAGRIPNIFASEDPEDKKQEGETEEEYGKRLIGKWSNEEQQSLVDFARYLLVSMVVSPKLVLNPRPERGELGPDDTGDDFWFLYKYGMDKFYREKVAVGDAEVEAKDLESFREESSVSGDSVDSLHVPVEITEREAGDPGLGSSAGA